MLLSDLHRLRPPAGPELVEHRWSYTVFLQVLGKYLDMKTEAGVTDWMFSYARESLLHYARWIARYERTPKYTNSKDMTMAV